MKNIYDVIIIGSGAAGGTLLYRLSKIRPDLKLLLIEKGRMISNGEEGRFLPFILSHYRRFAVGSRSKEGVVVYAGQALGGTTPMACGNLVWSDKLEAEFFQRGVDLGQARLEAEELTGAKPLPEHRIIRGSRSLKYASDFLGYPMISMPKGVSDKCDGCGDCVLACHTGAKWDTRILIEKSWTKPNVDTMVYKPVKRVVREGELSRVELPDLSVYARIVVFCAGGLATPAILQRSGVEAGKGLTIHPFINVYGEPILPLTQKKGMSMACYHKPTDDTLLSPFLDHWSQLPLACGLWWSMRHSLKKILGIMVKVADPEAGLYGKVNPDGSFHYRIEPEVRERLIRGGEIAREILLQADVAEASLMDTMRFPRGAHPSGTAKLGEVVGPELQVAGQDGWYVSDASVIPLATGTPPILTLVALNIFLAKLLAGKL